MPVKDVVHVDAPADATVIEVTVNGKKVTGFSNDPAKIVLPVLVGPKDIVEAVINEGGSAVKVPIKIEPAVIDLANVNFDLASSKLTAKAKAILDKVAKVVIEHGFTYIDL